MSSGFTPVNQVRYSNVAYVKLQKKGKKFEIACYRNKIVSWRNKIETDLQEVLQVKTVFTNVSKGMLASASDLLEAFGTSDQSLVCQEILEKGEMQISEQERVALLDSIFRDVASIVVEKSINPDNNRPYTISMIQNAMRQIHFSANISKRTNNTIKSSKSQALDVIRKLKAIMPIARASMSVRIISPAIYLSIIKEDLLKAQLGLIVNPEQIQEVIPTHDRSTSTTSSNHIQSKNQVNQVLLDLIIDPDQYRKIEDGISTMTAGVGRVEVLQMRVAQQASNNSNSNATVTPTLETITESSQQQLHKANDKQDGDIQHRDDYVNDLNSDSDTSNNDDDNDDLSEDINMALDIEKKLKKLALNNEYNHGYDDGDTPLGIVKKSKQKKKNKNKLINLTQQQLDIDDKSSEESEGEDGHIKTIKSAASSNEHIITNNNFKDKHFERDTTAAQKNNKGNKKGKTTKRMEKIEMLEREQKALKLKQRNQDTKDRSKGNDTAQDIPISVFSTVSVTETAERSNNSNNMDSSHEASGTRTNVNTSAAVASTTAVPAATVKSCNTCGGLFCDANSYRNHFRSDWHRYNLNQKLKNLPIVNSEEEFSKLSLKDLENNSIIT